MKKKNAQHNDCFSRRGKGRKLYCFLSLILQKISLRRPNFVRGRIFLHFFFLPNSERLKVGLRSLTKRGPSLIYHRRVKRDLAFGSVLWIPWKRKKGEKRGKKVSRWSSPFDGYNNCTYDIGYVHEVLHVFSTCWLSPKKTWRVTIISLQGTKAKEGKFLLTKDGKK
jgi:hypothetical protein